MKLISLEKIEIEDGVYMDRSVKFTHNNTILKFKCNKSCDDYFDCKITVKDKNAIVTIITEDGEPIVIDSKSFNTIQKIYFGDDEFEYKSKNGELIFIDVVESIDKCKVYQEKYNKEIYLVDFDGKYVICGGYETSSIYTHDKTITICGWDYNLIIDTKVKKIITKNVR